MEANQDLKSIYSKSALQHVHQLCLFAKCAQKNKAAGLELLKIIHGFYQNFDTKL